MLYDKAEGISVPKLVRECQRTVLLPAKPTLLQPCTKHLSNDQTGTCRAECEIREAKGTGSVKRDTKVFKLSKLSIGPHSR